MNKFIRYHKAVSFLENLSSLPIKGDYMIDRQNLDTYLKRMRYFLDLIGNPERDTEKFIHITGTAGKGSVTNMLHEVIYASGKRVGSFTSPFVMTSIEKIRVDDKYISPDEFADIVEYLKPFLNKAYTEGPYGRISYFETFLAMALIYFKKKKCDYVILEVGLGGRYDATNIIEKPIVTAVTNIDYDHREILGKTLAKIAHDKAGIIKSESEFFTSEQRPHLLKLFRKICKEKVANFNKIDKQMNYQKCNEALVKNISEFLGIDNDYIEKGVGNSHLQCRFEIIQKNPLVILDGAHNRIKVASTISNLKKLRFERLITILAIADNKEHLSILKQIVPISDQVFITTFEIKDRKCINPTDLLKKSLKYLRKNSRIEIIQNSREAMEKALEIANEKDVILAVGSFYLTGNLRKKWFPEEKILERRKSETICFLPLHLNP